MEMMVKVMRVTDDFDMLLVLWDMRNDIVVYLVWTFAIHLCFACACVCICMCTLGIVVGCLFLLVNFVSVDIVSD